MAGSGPGGRDPEEGLSGAFRADLMDRFKATLFDYMDPAIAAPLAQYLVAVAFREEGAKPPPLPQSNRMESTGEFIKHVELRRTAIAQVRDLGPKLAALTKLTKRLHDEVKHGSALHSHFNDQLERLKSYNAERNDIETRLNKASDLISTTEWVIQALGRPPFDGKN